VAPTVASREASSISFCVVNKKEIRKEFLSLCNVMSLEEYVCRPACNKLAARLRFVNYETISVENIFVPLRELLRSFVYWKLNILTESKVLFVSYFAPRNVGPFIDKR